MHFIRRRLLSAFALGLLVGAGSGAWAQAFPSVKPIRIVVPYAPGGPVDVTARIMA